MTLKREIKTKQNHCTVMNTTLLLKRIRSTCAQRYLIQKVDLKRGSHYSLKGLRHKVHSDGLCIIQASDISTGREKSCFTLCAPTAGSNQPN